MKKIAVLSNVNMNFVIRTLQKDLTVYEAEGYGNELGILLNPASSYHAFGAEFTFLVMDLMEVLQGETDSGGAEEKIRSWFEQLEAAVSAKGHGACIYYISDAYLWGAELSVMADAGRKQRLEQLWQKQLEAFCERHGNSRILPYRHMIEVLGEENAFSLKMWYLGRILLSNEAQKRLCELITERVRLEGYVPKKVLLLDLDNTLWGGLAGEADHVPVTLSEDHSGLAYKNLQKVILQMQRQGVLLGIVSKNNEEDAMEILEHHPHMVLRPELFVAKKINWEPKHKNIEEIAAELNLGLDSFVFFDDNPTERQLVKELVPQVTVPDFPGKPEELASAMVRIYQTYFAKPFVTEEDLQKTEQYAGNVKRKKLQDSAGSFEGYLEQLHITMQRVEPASHMQRVTQLANKTNQFNLTTRRYTQGELERMLSEQEKKIYLYQVADRFGDNGQVALVIVDLGGEAPLIEEFAMSCRVMGKRIEQAIVTDVEQDLKAAGYERLRGRYLPTSKNKPVQKLYEELGYEKVKELPEGGAEYEIKIAKAPKRVYYVNMASDGMAQTAGKEAEALD